jgi:hypothetical protein
LGLAIYNSVILEVKFPQILYKKLLGFDGSLSDLKDIHPVFPIIFFADFIYRILLQVLKNY